MADVMAMNDDSDEDADMEGNAGDVKRQKLIIQELTKEVQSLQLQLAAKDKFWQKVRRPEGTAYVL